MRILFLCQYFTPDITAAAFRMSDFARLLAEAGDEVRVITSYPHKVQVREVDDGPFEAAGVRVYRCRLREVRGTGARAYLRHYLSFVRGSLRLGWKIWGEGWRPDVIYASSPPLFVGVSGRVLSKLFRCPMVFEVRDIWPAAAVSAGQLRAGGRAYRLGRRLERHLYRRADHITCVAEPMKEYLTQHTSRPVTVVYNGIAVDHPVSLEPSVGPGPKNSPRTLLYAGNLGHVQQLDVLLRAMAELSNEAELEGWQVQLLGAGAQCENLRDLAKQLDLGDRVRFLAPVSRDEAAALMSRTDLLYLHLMHDETMERTIPSKLFDYLMAARPILAGLSGEGQQILNSTGANVVFPPGEITSLKAALLQAVRELSLRNEQAMENRKLVLDRFTRQQASGVLRNVFQSLVKQR